MDSTLTVSAGVIVKLLTHRIRFPAGGLLSVTGTAEKPVIITSLHDDTAGGDTNGNGSQTSPAPGDWSGLRLYPGPMRADLQNTEIRYCGGLGFGQIWTGQGQSYQFHSYFQRFHGHLCPCFIQLEISGTPTSPKFEFQISRQVIIRNTLSEETPAGVAFQ